LKRKIVDVFLLAALALLLAACSPRMLLVRTVADELAGSGGANEEDLGLARDAAAFHLKLSEQVLRQTPAHLALAEAVTGGFTQYAYAFIAFDADKQESKDARAAQRQRERAARMYARAHRHAMAALEAAQPGFAKALAGGTASVPADQVGLAYWGAAAWAGAISLSKDRPDTVADLPLAVSLAQLAYARDPGHGQGALAALMGTLEAARPGGSAAQAATYFDQATGLGGGRNAGVFVARAEALALPAGDRPGFEALLRQALVAADAQRDLGNQAMRERAQWLLDTIDDRF
jgi:predicted anti-sigma-YlaC factor YlaD